MNCTVSLNQCPTSFLQCVIILLMYWTPWIMFKLTSFCFFRKCKMSCWWYIAPNCLKRSILDAVLCLETIRYHVKLLYLFIYFIFMEKFCTIICKRAVYSELYNHFVSSTKVEDLSRMYRLFCKIPKGLDPVANIFKQVCLFISSSSPSSSSSFILFAFIVSVGKGAPEDRVFSY